MLSCEFVMILCMVSKFTNFHIFWRHAIDWPLKSSVFCVKHTPVCEWILEIIKSLLRFLNDDSNSASTSNIGIERLF